MKYLSTSARPYINGVKHLGNLVGSMLPADFTARYLRARGHDVLFICATDEHGTPAELAARAAHMTVQDYCDYWHSKQKRIYEDFHLSFNHFGRSSSKQNLELTQRFCKELDASGYIYEKTVKQIYSIADKRYLPDRYVIGTCPYCAYDAARGDQCENCTKVLDPTDLKNPRSAVSGSTDLEVRETTHLFLRQSTLSGALRSWIDRHSEWPLLVRSIALKWLDEGLKDRCITRDLEWGIPVDRLGFEGKVFYVWFDAPIAYISATKEWSESTSTDRHAWESWWKDENITYLQFMAKDNIPFHTISFPATIIGANSGWRLVDYIKGFNWLTYYDDKFSTSRGRGIFMDQALEEFPADWYRYWLLANAPESNDTSFSWELFQMQINKDLADTLGNFVSRALKFAASTFQYKVPEGGERTDLDHEYERRMELLINAYTAHCDTMQFRKALAALRDIWVLGNSYANDAAPWRQIKVDRARAAFILRRMINMIRLFALLSAPVIPATSEVLLKYVCREGDIGSWPSSNIGDELEIIRPGAAFQLPDIVFPKIDDSVIAKLVKKYGGSFSGTAAGL
jgi:methionyl-tRNA synthetase